MQCCAESPSWRMRVEIAYSIVPTATTVNDTVDRGSTTAWRTLNNESRGSSVEVTGVDGAVDDAVEVDAEAGENAEDVEAAVDAEVAEDEAEEAVKVQ
ncbi:hypothetical protein PV326_003354 [Microctonus aethiopoides]|nr:hypothetical protein PV326_003354 [Microctonus aethiopoides]